MTIFSVPGYEPVAVRGVRVLSIVLERNYFFTGNRKYIQYALVRYVFEMSFSAAG